MSGNQSKNTIKIASAVLFSVIFGEGVMGWGLYWPFLLLLVDRSGVFWLAFIVGILVSVFRGISVGLPSVFLVFVVGIVSLLLSSRRENALVVVVIAVIANYFFDRMFGFSSSIWESLSIVIFGVMGMKWFEKGETIRINY